MANLVYKGSKACLPEQRNATSFYLCEDTHEIYFGANLYTEAVRFYNGADKPENPAQGVLYISSGTGNGDVWNGTSWEIVFIGVDGVSQKIEEAIEKLDIENTYETKTDAAAKKTELEGKIDKKQDKIEFETAYDSTNNKAATMTDVKNATAGLSGAMHWQGEVDTVPTDDEGGKYKNGDVVSVEGVEYAYNGTSWVELGDESSKHKHNNLTTLEKITDDELTNWDAAYQEKHTHENADELDKIETGDVTKWKAAEAKAHEHENKTVLDEFATGDKAKLDTASTTAAKAASDIDDINVRLKAVEEAVTVGTFAED